MLIFPFHGAVAPRTKWERHGRGACAKTAHGGNLHGRAIGQRFFIINRTFRHGMLPFPIMQSTRGTVQQTGDVLPTAARTKGSNNSADSTGLQLGHLKKLLKQGRMDPRLNAWPGG